MNNKSKVFWHEKPKNRKTENPNAPLLIGLKRISALNIVTLMDAKHAVFGH